MKFKKADEGHSEFLEEMVSSFVCQKRKMFGSPVYFVNGSMFTGVHQDSIFLRLSEEDREKTSRNN
jgi:TfoX/Sxy family transcriptional regulator of competence genes